MIFNNIQFKTKTVTIAGAGEFTLHEISPLDRARAIDLWQNAEKSDKKLESMLNANAYLVYCALRPGIKETESNVIAELKTIPKDILNMLIDEAMILAGFDDVKSEGEEPGK